MQLPIIPPRFSSHSAVTSDLAALTPTLVHISEQPPTSEVNPVLISVTGTYVPMHRTTEAFSGRGYEASCVLDGAGLGERLIAPTPQLFWVRASPPVLILDPKSSSPVLKIRGWGALLLWKIVNIVTALGTIAPELLIRFFFCFTD